MPFLYVLHCLHGQEKKQQKTGYTIAFRLSEKCHFVQN